MDKKILIEFKKEFDMMKKALRFKSTYEQLDEIYFLEDYILKEGFVSTRLSRSICRRINELYNSWGGYLHNLIIPPPGSLVAMHECQAFNDDDKKVITALFNEILFMGSWNNAIGLTKDRLDEGRFIDYSVKFWNDKFNPQMQKLNDKLKDYWHDQMEKPGQ